MKIFLFIIFSAVNVLCYSQSSIKVLDVVGQIKSTINGKKSLLSSNDILDTDFSLNIEHEASVLLLHNSGKTIAINGPRKIDLTQINEEFEKGIESNPLWKYSQELYDISKTDLKQVYDKDRKLYSVEFSVTDSYQAVFNQLYREKILNTCKPNKYDAPILINSSTYLWGNVLHFGKIEGSEIIIEITSPDNERLFSLKTKENKAIIDTSTLKGQKLVVLQAYDTEGIKNKWEHDVQMYALATYNQGIKDKVFNKKEVEKSMQSASTAFDYMCLGYMFLKSGCNMDAQTYFKKAIEMEPKKLFYKYLTYKILKKLIINTGSVHRKPVIYLYSEKKQSVNVKLDYPGELTVTYPQYPSEGWNVVATPEGKITDPSTNRTYDYLYWEGKTDQNLNHLLQSDEGYMIRGANTISFLEEVLPKYGLNDSEMNDFITYWLPDMAENEYNHIRFLVGDECNELAGLDVTPKPTTAQRLYMIYKASDGSTKLKTPGIQPFERKGFTVIEWGGIDLTEKNRELVYYKK